MASFHPPTSTLGLSCRCQVVSANDGKNDRKATLQALHTAAVVKSVQCHERNVVLDGRPPPISNSEKELTRKKRSTLAQLRSGYCRLLGSYKSRIKKDANLDVCADWHDAS